jgi:DNA-binding LacI/PurR family transcriptional regulator
MIDKNNKDRHLFELVVNDLKKKIYSGFYEPNEKLPNFLELTQAYDVSMSTIKKAMQVLNDEEFLVSRVGKGTFINKNKLEHHLKLQNPTNKILFSIINSNDADFFNTLRIVENVAEDLGKELEVEIHKDMHSHESSISRISKKGGYDVLILGTSRKTIYGVKLFQKLQDKIATVFCHDIYDSDFPIITVDNHAVGELAAKHLLKLSNRKICIVLDENGYKSDDLKLQGFMRTLEKNYSRSRCLVVRNSFQSKGSTYEDGYRLGAMIDLESSEIDAVFASNDEVARGFQEAVKEKNEEKLKDLIILGFGGLKGNKKRKYDFCSIGLDKTALSESYRNYFAKVFKGDYKSSSSEILIKPKLISRKN